MQVVVILLAGVVVVIVGMVVALGVALVQVGVEDQRVRAKKRWALEQAMEAKERLTREEEARRV